MSNLSKVTELLSGKATKIWSRQSSLDTCSWLLHCQCWRPIWLTVSPYSACTANPWMFNLPFFLHHHLHFYHSTYQLTGFHETISSPRTEWKQMDKGPRQSLLVWISGGTLSPICFYLGNVLRSKERSQYESLSTILGKRLPLVSLTYPPNCLWVCCFHLNIQCEL